MTSSTSDDQPSTELMRLAGEMERAAGSAGQVCVVSDAAGRERDPLIERVVLPAIDAIQYEAVIGPDIVADDTLLQVIWERIRDAVAVVIDFRQSGPSVSYYLGLCHAIDKVVILLAERATTLPPDLKMSNVITFDTNEVAWESGLRTGIQRMLVSRRSRASSPVLRPPASVVSFEQLSGLQRELDDARSQYASMRRKADEAQVRSAALEREHGRLKDALEAKLRTIAEPNSIVVIDSDDGVPTARLQSERGGVAVDLVHIPEGYFTYGFGEQPEQVYLPEFWISKYSITNEQYAAFLNCYGNRSEGAAPPYISLDGASPADKCRLHIEDGLYVVDSGYEQHPVTYVNWYGAEAFCSWLGGQLPTSEMWEKAVRGVDGRLFPWGDDEPNSAIANVDEDGKWARDVQPVAVHENLAGSSPFGVVQGIGNVWHWTGTHFPERGVQAVRGGSFFDFRLGLRQVYRFNVQGGPDFSQGFLFARRFLAEDDGKRG